MFSFLTVRAVGAVEALQATEHVRQLVSAPKHQYRPGAACRLTAGPLRGQDAVVEEVAGENAVVTVLMLGELRRVVVPLAAWPRTDGRSSPEALPAGDAS